jgi:signal transduction histidine kinase
VRISGPAVNWQSHPAQVHPDWPRDRPTAQEDWNRERWGGDKNWRRLVSRATMDGHTVEFGLSDDAFERRPRLIGFTLAGLLLITLLAYLYVRRLLRPLDDIRVGAQRFGAGEFDQTIPVRHARHPDELGELAVTINTMGADIHNMLDAKRALLLAISHELRSPLTRARLNTELLPDTPELAPNRAALLFDLALMRDLITDLLESERLASPHVVLHREPTDLAALVREVVAGLEGAPKVVQHLADKLPLLPLDRSRMRLLLRNLLDNALRHSADAPEPPAVVLQQADGGQVVLTVRDHGPGVPQDQLPQLAQPFFRPDAARTREGGGVGLGLYLCKRVALAHGSTFSLRNAQPGLEVSVTLPGA